MREIWEDYITEVAWRHPGVGVEFFLAERRVWHARHGLDALFPFPWGDGEPPGMGDPWPEDF